ncbi:hypothetical protein LXA43DRAFT_1125692 [Ganoderma leucocontextum]|nr:hypothetical protein LXA43DRAFT_1125692 [Ganoderma leucocontextum]
MQRIRKLSNDLKLFTVSREALIPKSDKPEPRRRPSYRTEHDSVAFPSSSSRPKTRTKSQEKPVPVPSLNHKQTRSEGMYWDRDASGTSPVASPYRYALGPHAKGPLPSPSATVPVKKPHHRCPYSPSKYFTVSHSTSNVPFPAETRTPATNDRNPASPADAHMSTSHSTHSIPAWPPEGPATVKRHQRTPKSSVDSLYRSQTDMKDFRAPATTASPRYPGHSRTASAPHSRDAQTLPRPRGQQVTEAARDAYPDPEPKALFSDEVSSISSRSSYRTASSTREPKTSLQVREFSTSRSVHVESGSVRRAASHRAQIVYPSYVSTALPPVPTPPRHTSTRRGDQAAPRRTAPARQTDKFYTSRSTSRASQEQRIEVSYITMREVAQMEGKKTHKDLSRELARWDRVDANAVPAPGPSSGGTRPLVVKKRSAMFGAREPRW